ncbi:MAG TPA: serine/threonine-protein kinase [Kofleriaceae bacterium]|nr:serine/threonine-protein kinase [Kofleriaceae bacterium]
MSLHHEGPALGVETLPRIFGRYLLVDRLSQGGMGEIFLARHGMSGFEKLVVIKKVLPHLAADREFLSRFIDEATVAVHLQHANVAQVFEVGRVEDEYFLALEYVAGNDLRATQNALIESGRAMPVELALLIAREAAAGLAYAHRRTDANGAPLGVVHCDISPPNIVLSFEGEVKIIDFGIARSARRLTETNPERGFGKFGYLAPEQLIKGGVLDQRTDTYALGVVLYEMLTGRRMFEVGDSPDYKALARMVVKGMHPLPSQVDKKLAPYDELIATALKPDPADRFPNAADFRDAIQRALVKVNPTINADHLGILVRELFAGTEVDRRRALSEMDKTDIERWRRELDNQVTSTVSFALAGRAAPIHTAEFEPHEPEPEPHDRFDVGGPSIEIQPEAAANIRPAAADDQGTLDTEADRESAELPILRHPPRGRGAVFAVILVLLMAGTAGAAYWLQSRSSGEAEGAKGEQAAASESRAAPPPAAAAAPVQTLTRPPPVVVTELPPSEAKVEEPVTMPPEPVEPPSARGKGKRPPPPRKAKPPRKSAQGAEEVQARFRSARREYAAFKERFGARLEAEWNELADRATYARTPQQLADLDRKIRQFRARMSSEKWGPKGEPLDPLK